MWMLLLLAISVVLTAGLALVVTLFIRLRAVQPRYDPQKAPPPEEQPSAGADGTAHRSEGGSL